MIGVAARKPFLIGVSVLTALAAADVTVQLLRHVWGLHDLFGFIPLFDFDAVANLPTFFSVFLLACCCALLGLIGAFERHRDKRASNYWFGLSVLAGYVTVDEGSQIHEAVGAVFGDN
jgi:hypothetical protein